MHMSGREGGSAAETWEGEEMGKDSFCPMQPARCFLSPPSVQKGALWAGGQSRPMGQWETDSREPPPPIPQGPALIGGALQLSDKDSSSLVMHNSQRLRYCHNKHIH